MIIFKLAYESSESAHPNKRLFIIVSGGDTRDPEYGLREEAQTPSLPESNHFDAENGWH